MSLILLLVILFLLFGAEAATMATDLDIMVVPNTVAD